MLKAIGIKFKENGKIYYFLDNNLFFEKNTNIIAKTNKGLEFGTVVVNEKIVEDNNINSYIKSIVRVADESDCNKHKKNQKIEKDAFLICSKKIKKYNLDMKLIESEVTFDLNKYIFYFTADGRVDFRELVRDLASIFKTRIELRQIGVRDEAKLLNGIGICGRTLCCSTFLRDFQTVSIKMAKDQNLSLNPSKISGVCGRLMCCLKYEQDFYEEFNKKLPKEGDIINTKEGKGEVLSVNTLRQIVKAAVRKNENDAPDIMFFNINEIDIIHRKVNKEEIIDDEELKGIED